MSHGIQRRFSYQGGRPTVAPTVLREVTKRPRSFASPISLVVILERKRRISREIVLLEDDTGGGGSPGRSTPTVCGDGTGDKFTQSSLRIVGTGVLDCPKKQTFTISSRKAGGASTLRFAPSQLCYANVAPPLPM